MSPDYQQLVDAIAVVKTRTESALVLALGLPELIAAKVAAAVAAGATAEQLATLTNGLVAETKENIEQIIAAINANTPPEPAPEPDPA